MWRYSNPIFVVSEKNDMPSLWVLIRTGTSGDYIINRVFERDRVPLWWFPTPNTILVEYASRRYFLKPGNHFSACQACCVHMKVRTEMIAHILFKSRRKNFPYQKVLCRSLPLLKKLNKTIRFCADEISSPFKWFNKFLFIKTESKYHMRCIRILKMWALTQWWKDIPSL